MKKTLIKKLLTVFEDVEDKNLEGFKAFDEGVAKLKAELKEKIQVNTLDDVNSELDKFKKRINLEPLEKAIDALKEDFSQEIGNLLTQVETKMGELSNLHFELGTSAREMGEGLNEEISDIRGKIKDLITEKSNDLKNLRDEIAENGKISDKKVTEWLKNIDEKVNTEVKIIKDRLEITENKGEEMSKSIPQLKAELLTKIRDHGGGNMNRNIAIGGNTSVLSKFTDINLKAGPNVTITYTNNQTTKYTDITIAATGGGSSTAGIIRSIQTVNTSQTMGSVAGTDYVYLASAGIKLDLPPATGNTNLYTVKNVSNSSILVSGTVDDDASGIIMPVKYTSVDLISNDTDWKIT